LFYVQPPSGSTEVQFLGYSNEAAKMT